MFHIVFFQNHEFIKPKPIKYVKYKITKRTMQQFNDKNVDLEKRVSELLNRMTVDEKIKLLRGKGFYTGNGIKRIGIPAFKMTDGPLGVAAHSSNRGIRTRFPATIGLAATWNKKLAYLMGKAMGKETKLAGRHQILAPGVNLIRSPLCGRNFEYLSEDPFLSSEIGAEIVKGIQSEGIASCVKHYITNNSETKRTDISTEINERVFHEVYVKNFKRIIKKSDPWGIMSSYNKINGKYCSENKLVLRNILRDQLGFTGHVVTDWGAAKKVETGAIGCIKAGLSLEMPGLLMGKTYNKKKVRKAFDSGQISESDIDYVVRPFLRTYFRVGLLDNQFAYKERISNIPEHHKLAQEIAEESIVLLKNELNILPLNLQEIKKIAILGPNARKKFGKFATGGSSAVIPPKFITPFDGIASYIKNKADIVEKPEDADIVILVLGLDHGDNIIKMLMSKKEGDTEGKDRTKLELHKTQIQLFQDTIRKNPNTIVILIAGSPIDCSPFIKHAPALLNAWYPSMMGGNAIARILFGDVNPSGKLPITYPNKLKDHPAHLEPKRFPGDLENLKIYYDEGIYIGYRYFDKENIEPQFPFGYGQSYTSFELSNLKIISNLLKSSKEFSISVTIKNIGRREGSEIIQVYITKENSAISRPIKELLGFSKVKLSPNETKNVEIILYPEDFEYYSEKEHKFVFEPGNYTISIGTSSRDIYLKSKVLIVE